MTQTLTDYELFEQASPENRLLHREEQLIFDVTEALSEALEQAGLSKTELARRLGKSKGFVSQLLAGGRNLTLRTLADVADALDCRVQFKVVGKMSFETDRPWGQQTPAAEWGLGPRQTIRLLVKPGPGKVLTIERVAA
jgi:ribosome-binding protein aMBF1 (putative translation factor)